MTDNLRALEDWAGALLAKLSAGERRQLTQSIARDLRRSQQQRITGQKNPDGSAYIPRKTQPAREKKGRIKKMFSKLKQGKHLRIQATPEAAYVGFVGRAARIARVHQEGLSDRVSRGGPMTTYAQRQLLGLTDPERELIHDRLLEHLSKL